MITYLSANGFSFRPTRRWHKVSLTELRELHHYLNKIQVCYNGCTHHALELKYGAENVKHIMGKGWYKLCRIP